jgi:hypothetical protein
MSTSEAAAQPRATGSSDQRRHGAAAATNDAAIRSVRAAREAVELLLTQFAEGVESSAGPAATDTLRQQTWRLRQDISAIFANCECDVEAVAAARASEEAMALAEAEAFSRAVDELLPDFDARMAAVNDRLDRVLSRSAV